MWEQQAFHPEHEQGLGGWLLGAESHMLPYEEEKAESRLKPFEILNNLKISLLFPKKTKREYEKIYAPLLLQHYLQSQDMEAI